MKIRPKNWREFQHYHGGKNGKGRPPWIKLHHKILDDKDFQTLPIASRALAPMLWLMAADTPAGTILTADIAWRLRMTDEQVSEALNPLIERAFFEVVDGDPSSILGKPYDIPTGEKRERGESEREKNPLVRLAPDGGRKVNQLRKAEALQLLEFLNGKARKHFRPVAANLSLIEARLAEGISLQDLKTLTVRKCREWLGTDQERYLRPETLYNARKCHSYLGEVEPEERGQPCNAPDAIDRSSQPQSPAPADGVPPTSLESLAVLH